MWNHLINETARPLPTLGPRLTSAVHYRGHVQNLRPGPFLTSAWLGLPDARCVRRPLWKAKKATNCP